MDEKGWKDHYPGYHDLIPVSQKEIDDTMNQAAGGLILHV
jgi:hypothetical protein